MSSGSTGGPKKNAYCSFCRKSYRDVGPLVEGPGDVYICGECIELCQSILDQERRRRGVPKTLFTDIPTPREIKEQLDAVRDRPGAGQEGPVGRRPQPLQAAGPRRGPRDRRRARQVQHPADRPDRLRQDPAGPDPGPGPERPVRHRRRHHADRGRLRRRGRREPAAQAAARRRLRPRGRPARHHLHRRDRQDRQDQPERLDHPRRLRRGRAAGPARRCSKGTVANVPPQGGRKHPEQQYIQMDTTEHPVHLRRHLRRPREHHRPPRRPQDDRLRQPDAGRAAHRPGRAARPGHLRRPARVRHDPRVHRPAAGHLPARCRSTSTPWSRS